MLEPFLLFLAGLAGTLVLTPYVLRLSARWGAMDEPGERKIHEHPVPRLGGLAIFGTFSIASLLALLASERLRASFEANAAFWLSLAAGATLVFLLGIYDDIRHASVWMKFAVQFAAALLPMAWGGIRIEQLGVPFDGVVSLGWLSWPLTALWIVGVTNAFNLIDGLDGLAGGIAFISITTIFTISLMAGGRSLVVLVSAALSGALLGFLRYNRYPAQIFLGDCGSMFLGFMLAVLSVVGVSKKTTTLALLIPILVVGVPVFDTLFAMGRRFAKKVVVEKEWRPSALRAMFRADKSHIHHVLLDMGYTHRKTVFILYGMSIILALFAVVASIAANDRNHFGLIIAGAAVFVIVRQWGKFIALPGFGGGRKNGEGAE